MNAWDVVTWLAAVVLATTAAVIFGFFLRDARSILNREMHDHDHDHDHEAKNSSPSAVTPGTARPTPPEDFPR